MREQFGANRPDTNDPQGLSPIRLNKQFIVTRAFFAALRSPRVEFPFDDQGSLHVDNTQNHDRPPNRMISMFFPSCVCHMSHLHTRERRFRHRMGCKG